MNKYMYVCILYLYIYLSTYLHTLSADPLTLSTPATLNVLPMGTPTVLSGQMRPLALYHK